MFARSLNRTHHLFLVESAHHSNNWIHAHHSKQPQLFPAECHRQMTASLPPAQWQPASCPVSTFLGGGGAGHGWGWSPVAVYNTPPSTSFLIHLSVAGVVQPVTNLLCSTGMWTHSTCVIMKGHATCLAEGQLQRAGGDSTSLRENLQLCLVLQDCFIWDPTCPEAPLPFSPASTSWPPLQPHSQLPLASL